jgi:general secretion pathway protein I
VIRRRQRGFSLLEVLVAFALLAGAIGLLLSIISGGIRQVRVAGERTEIAALAESLIATLGVASPIEPGDFGGESDDGRYRWHLVVEEVASEALADPFADIDATLDAASGGDEEDAERDSNALDGTEAVELEQEVLEEFGAPVLYRIDLEVQPVQSERATRFSTLRLRNAPELEP